MTTVHDRRGFTLIEVTIILMVLVILGTIMLPQLGNYNRLARFVKVREDLGAICSVMKKMLDEVMLSGFYGKPGTREWPIGLLVGPGAKPIPGSAGYKGQPWLLPVRDAFVEHTDVRHEPVWFMVDQFDQHLQENNPLNTYYPGPDDKYMNPIDNPERWAAGAFFGWRGPYLDEFTADPWANRYMANVFALHRPRDHDYHPNEHMTGDLFTSAVVCYSAGPDAAVDTAFNQPMNDADRDGFYGWKTNDDDLAVVLSAGGPF